MTEIMKIMKEQRVLLMRSKERIKIMKREKNTVFEVEIVDMSDTGEGIGKADGFIWFIKDAVIGDRVEAKVMKTKKSYGYARLVRVLEPSLHRITPPCPVARSCGGCQLQAMDYSEQLRFKENKVYNNLKRLGGLDCEKVFEPIIGMKDPWHYRNKAQFPLGRNRDGQIITGFYAGRTHTIIESSDCLLGIPENKIILSCIREYMKEYKIAPYDEEKHRGLIRHVLIRKGFKTGQMMICLVINGEVQELRKVDGLVERLKGLFPAGEEKNREVAVRDCKEPKAYIETITCSINQEKTNVILGQKIVNLYGPGFITDYIGTIQYRISPLSFYQVNPIQTEKLYETALEYAGLTGKETVWDLYCGIGTISLFLAQKAKKVYGVETVSQAVEDAHTNAALNGITNAEFFVGKAEEILPEQFEKNHIYADVIVVDPPRKGCDPLCLDTMVKMAPRRIVYVSCDPATLARDLKRLGESGYEVVRGRMVDMFAQTGHIETVCLLSKLKSTQHIEVEVKMDEMDLTTAEKKATYDEIKAYVLEHSGLKVSSLYIAQVKQKCGIIERENYNKSKSEDAKQPQCPPEKEKAIMEALKHFGMI